MRTSNNTTTMQEIKNSNIVDKNGIRYSSIKWWNSLSSNEDKQRICDIHTKIVGNNRRWESLTGREIQMLYETMWVC